MVRDLIAHPTDEMEKPLEDCGNKEIVPEPPRLDTFMLDVDGGVVSSEKDESVLDFSIPETGQLEFFLGYPHQSIADVSCAGGSPNDWFLEMRDGKRVRLPVEIALPIPPLMVDLSTEKLMLTSFSVGLSYVVRIIFGVNERLVGSGCYGD